MKKSRGGPTNRLWTQKFFQKSIIAVVPLISGSGQQNKILEAMSNGLPVITTTKGARPFGFINNKDLLIEDKSLNFASSFVLLHFCSKNFFISSYICVIKPCIKIYNKNTF